MSLVPLPRGPRALSLRAPGLLGPELALAAFADWLFWNRGVGLSLPIFCAAVAIVALRLRRGRSVGPRRGAVALLLLAAAMPATYRVTALSVAFALAGTLAALRLDADPGALGGFRRLAAAARLIVCGPGRVVLDLDMMAELGPEALPALDRYALGSWPRAARQDICRIRGLLEEEVRDGMSDWRSWSLAGWRLGRYLDTVGVAAAVDCRRESDDP